MTDRKEHPLQALIDAPLADANKINLPAGRRPAPRGAKVETDMPGVPKFSSRELREKKQRAAEAKLDALFTYYATTDLPAEKIAEHMGLYRNVQTGTDDKGKPVMTRVLDVQRAEQQIIFRRRAAA